MLILDSAGGIMLLLMIGSIISMPCAAHALSL